MKIAISNIAWNMDMDDFVYKLMEELGYIGLEIAPSRIIPNAPYDHLDDIINWYRKLKGEYGFLIPSMQSIWYRKEENLFSSAEECKELTAYTKKAILFAEKLECHNLVLGCPKNRRVPDGIDAFRVAIPFFREIAEFASDHNTIIGLEAVSAIYNTNFINETLTAIEFIKEVNCEGLKLNLDVGTVIQNNENISMLEDNISCVNHVHISEPGLKEILKRDIHIQLRNLLQKEKYDGYISIEMGKGYKIENVMKYVRDIFGN